MCKRNESADARSSGQSKARELCSARRPERSRAEPSEPQTGATNADASFNVWPQLIRNCSYKSSGSARLGSTAAPTRRLEARARLQTAQSSPCRAAEQPTRPAANLASSAAANCAQLDAKSLARAQQATRRRRADANSRRRKRKSNCKSNCKSNWKQLKCARRVDESTCACACASISDAPILYNSSWRRIALAELAASSHSSSAPGKLVSKLSSLPSLLGPRCTGLPSLARQPQPLEP